MSSTDPTPTIKPMVNGDDSHDETLQFSDIESCIADFAAGNFLIVLDSPSRENEGDLIIAASHLSPAKSAFMIRHTSGYLCTPVSPTRATLLDLPPMLPLSANSDPNRTNYTITVDAASDVTTGISARDRSVTCGVLGEEGSKKEDLRRPGHVVPLVARGGGVRERRGHTEAGWEFGRLAGVRPSVAVIGELVVDGVGGASPVSGADSVVPRGSAIGSEGEVQGGVQGDGGEGRRKKPEYEGAGMMRARECVEFGREWGIRCCTIEDLVRYVEEREGKLESSGGGT